MGGTFEIDKKDVLDIKRITIERAPTPEQVPEEKTGRRLHPGKKRL